MAHERLIRKLRKAKDGCADLDADIYEALGYQVIRGRTHARGIARRYKGDGQFFGYHERWVSQASLTTSIDDALAFVGDWHVTMDGAWGYGEPSEWVVTLRSHDASHCMIIKKTTLPLILCAARLEAGYFKRV